mmetsp:Transcript_19058/g.44394  ORF Transcript_19058/g.44394 Transcript_19058/m.44394 type:complete len:156 (+) Transcript_19058:75-542(+)|eukprot:CAMPEP_0116836636 /NCGR_PEP_ID=MMETSP0418-20121206/8210_1 /TAXON_ID=1158023 /ORGANISM="Astrosyne radiata, Strain 13vi08-1A" /LENGTH=155 /DNA_ID=CAMNT_0004466435 /DNA_START=45 /DNA_END=512 /DNA_ORIENTATION=+
MGVGDNATTFEEREFDVSISPLCWLCLAPLSCAAIPYKTTLHLGTEEVTKTDVSICGQSVSKRPYGELGSVEKATCLCCVNASSSFGDICPGCGCETDLVEDLVRELKDRQRGRGDTAQIKRAEQTLQRLDDIESKLDAIMSHLKIPDPGPMERA